MCCSSFISAQSFVIDICNGPPIESDLNNVCLHPLSRTFTLSTASKKLLFFENNESDNSYVI